MNAKEVRALSVEDLKKKLMDSRQELMNLRFQVVTGQLTDTSRFKVTRRQIALFETVLSERAHAEKEGKK
ncbi:MAG: 50S ribosomal protein L29 [Anaerolineaceae bacterium]|nr:50S ribosomal protein L29 [Anaerolineaceae bacterium]